MASVDILLVVALEEEWKECRLVLGGHAVPKRVPKSRTVSWEFEHLGKTFAAEVAVVQAMGGVPAATAATIAILQSVPRYIVNIGIAAGLSDEIRLGDVVVAESVEEYSHRGRLQPNEHGSSTDLKGMKYGGRTISVAREPIKIVRDMRILGMSDWKTTCRGSLLQLLNAKQRSALGRENWLPDEPSVFDGPIACGEFLIADEEVRSMLLNWKRIFLAAEMESAGVSYAAAEAAGSNSQCWIIKGISDFGDARKKEIDRVGKGAVRRYATQNACRLFTALLANGEGLVTTPKQATGSELRTALHNQSTASFLPPYSDLQQLAPWDGYNDLFGRLCRVAEKDEPAVPYTFDLVLDRLERLNVLQEAIVAGDSGSGKSTLMQLIYWRIYQRYAEGDRRLFPVYVDLPRTILNAEEKGKRGSSVQEAIVRVASQVKSAVDDITPESRTVLLIEGADDESQGTTGAIAVIRNLLQRINCVFVTSSSEHVADIGNSVPLGIFFAPDQEKGNDPADLVAAFVCIGRPEGDAYHAKQFRDTIQRFQLQSLDLFLLGMAWDCAFRPKEALQAQPYIAEYRVYCNLLLAKSLEQSGVSANTTWAYSRACELAFAWLMDQQISRNANPKQEERAARSLVRRHARIRDFLAAEQIYRNLNKKKHQEHMDYVYPYRVNRILKDIINRDDVSQRKILVKLASILKQSNKIKLLAHACYLAGRFSKQTVVNEARSILSNFKKRFEHTLRNNRRYAKQPLLLLERTLYLSRIYLGDEDAHVDYINRLLRDMSWNEVNRGFHLEYYGDISFLPGDALTHADKGKEWGKTRDQLCKRLTATTDNPLYTIEALTLASLAQKRLEMRSIDPEVRTQVVTVLEYALSRKDITLENARGYLGMVIEHLKQEQFSVGDTFRSYYQIKTRPRAGWVRRKLEVGETVAAHTYGAYLLALFLLPDSWANDPAYNKNTVLQMLLIHDLAEAIMGDTPSPERTEVDREQERKEMDKLGYLGTYEGFGDLTSYSYLFVEFEEGGTINAKVAKEIDKLENLVQLRQFVTQGVAISDAATWEARLRADIRTPIVQRMLAALVDDPSPALS